MSRIWISPQQSPVLDLTRGEFEDLIETFLQRAITYVDIAIKRRRQLWQRVAKAMKVINLPDSIAEHILDKRDPAILAANLEDWLKAEPPGSNKRR